MNKKQKTKKNKNLITGASWNFDMLEKAYEIISNIAIEKYNLNFYTNQLEIITSDQMLEAYSSIAMPVMYNHWSFGKNFVIESNSYKRGEMGLAYEIVSNTNPCIAYLMEENTMCMQMLVISHASIGHNSFFKNNYLFKQWTNASTIVDYLVFAKNYVLECEEKYGSEDVESVLDSCHALMNYGVFKYKRPEPLSMIEEKEKQLERIKYQQETYNELWRTIPKTVNEEVSKTSTFPSEPEENILYFIEQNSPHLENWKRELIRIVRNVSQYFSPQSQTKVSNEGWATFWHHTIMNDLYDEGYIDDGYMLEFFKSHTSVIYQPGFDSKYFNGINPYALGFSIYKDIQRICINPTEEDKEWFPDFAGNNDWLKTVKWAMEDFKDSSFIQQFLSPKVIRDLRLFSIFDDHNEKNIKIESIHNKEGYLKIRNILSNQYDINEMIPNIQVYNFDIKGNRSLHLKHYQINKQILNEKTTIKTMGHIMHLWGYPIMLSSISKDDRLISELFIDNDDTTIKYY